jgi:MoxR-like ATPase
MSDTQLADWRNHALTLESEVNKVVVGQETPVRLITTSIFARGHVLLEGDVGVGKTTLLRAFSRGIGGAYQRIEGTIDLMPNDLVYHTYLGEDGKPHVSAGPLLMSGENLSIFFFNEINRARPQVHSLLLRVMAERSLTAFNKEHYFPHMLVFADRNQVEKEETFDIPSAARDRFMMEIPIAVPSDPAILESLVFDTRYHDVDALVGKVPEDLLQFDLIASQLRLWTEEVRGKNIPQTESVAELAEQLIIKANLLKEVALKFLKQLHVLYNGFENQTSRSRDFGAGCFRGI